MVSGRSRNLCEVCCIFLVLVRKVLGQCEREVKEKKLHFLQMFVLQEKLSRTIIVYIFLPEDEI